MSLCALAVGLYGVVLYRWKIKKKYIYLYEHYFSENCTMKYEI